jgi:hypothetical protein
MDEFMNAQEFQWGKFNERCIAPLTGHKYASAYTFSDSRGGYGLVSYKTQVLHIDKEGWCVVTGLYSPTTIKHIGWFVREFLPHLTYYTLKKVCIDELKINVKTGEIKPLTTAEKAYCKEQWDRTYIPLY